MSLYPIERIQSLTNVEAELAGGSWLNRAKEAGCFTQHSFGLLQVIGQALLVPTPTSEPCDEIDQLRAILREWFPSLRISRLGANQVWPRPKELLRAIAWANYIAIPGGNLPDYLEKAAGPVGEALKRKFLSGKAVFVGSSCGTVSWFDQIHTADRPSSQGGGTFDHYRLESGLGAVPGYVCAHYNERNEHSGEARAHLFQEMMRLQPVGSIGFGIDTQAALILDKGKMRCATRDRYAHVQIIKTLKDNQLDIKRLLEGKDDLTLEEVYAA
ncbi:MAG: hypothetical protein NVS3B29_07370 [Candidatus Saccharimonadales bacterium]